MRGDFGAISVTERSFAEPILKVECFISDRFCATLCDAEEQGLESTETEVNIQEWGLGFSLPNPLGQPLRLDYRCVWTTCSISVSLLFILYLSEHIALLSPPICRSLVLTVWLSIAQSQFSSNLIRQRLGNSWSQGDGFTKTYSSVFELVRTPFIFVHQSLAIVRKYFTSWVGWTSLNSIKGHK